MRSAPDVLIDRSRTEDLYPNAFRCFRLADAAATTVLEGRVGSNPTVEEPVAAAHVSSDDDFPFVVTSEPCSMEKYQVPRQWTHSLHEFEILDEPPEP